jgi:hypothetical protein
MVSIKTNALTKHTLRALDIAGYNVWRQNNGAVYDAKFEGYRRNSSTPGISDIIGYHKKTGTFIAAEIKAGKDKLSKEQEIFLSQVKRAGGIAIVIKNIDDVENILKGNIL